jgi:hypothetical protein
VASEVPKVTPYLLERGPTMCPRRLLFTYEGRLGTADTFTRWRLRDPLVEAARLVHAAMARPVADGFGAAPMDAVAEERALWDRAVATYVNLFGAAAAMTVTGHGGEAPTLSPGRGVRLGGAVDLVVLTEAGEAELRQFELWGGPVCARPLASFEIGMAVLRLARWGSGRRLLVRHVDLFSGALDEHEFDYATDLDAVRQRFDGRLEEVRSHMGAAVAVAGVECGTCNYIAGCPEHR